MAGENVGANLHDLGTGFLNVIPKALAVRKTPEWKKVFAHHLLDIYAE